MIHEQGLMWAAEVLVVDPNEIQRTEVLVSPTSAVVMRDIGGPRSRSVEIAPPDVPAALSLLVDLGPRTAVDSWEVTVAAESLARLLDDSADGRTQAGADLAEGLPTDVAADLRQGTWRLWSICSNPPEWSEARGRQLWVLDTPGALGLVTDGGTGNLTIERTDGQRLWQLINALMPSEGQLKAQEELP